MKTDDLIEDEYNGIKFAITQEAIDDLLTFHNIDAIAEIKDIFTREFENYPAIVKTKYRLKADAIGVESQYFCLKLL